MKNTIKKITLMVCLISATYGFGNYSYVFENQTNIDMHVAVMRSICAEGHIVNQFLPANGTISAQGNLCCANSFGFVGTFKGVKFSTVAKVDKLGDYYPIKGLVATGLQYKSRDLMECNHVYIVIKMIEDEKQIKRPAAFVKDINSKQIFSAGVFLDTNEGTIKEPGYY